MLHGMSFSLGKSVALTGAVVFVLFLPALAGAQMHQRSGFTLELGMGFGATEELPEGHQMVHQYGQANTLSLGCFVHRDWALLYHSHSITNYLTDSPGASIFAFSGVHLQHWFSDRFFISGGPGFAGFLFGDDAFVWRESDKRGFGLGFRAGFSFANSRHHSLRFSLEMSTGFFDGLTTLAQSLSLDWQYF
jgi:hypothetical protein